MIGFDFFKFLRIIYREDGTVLFINRYHSKTGKLISTVDYKEDGETIHYVKEYDPNTGNPIILTEYKYDGKTILKLTNYDLRFIKRNKLK